MLQNGKIVGAVTHVSDGISASGETVTLKLSKPETISEVRLTFDTNFNYSIKQTMSIKRQKQQRIGPPTELVKDYTVTLLCGGERYTKRQ